MNFLKLCFTIKKTLASTYTNGYECSPSSLLHLFYIRSSLMSHTFWMHSSGRNKSTSSLQTCQTIVSWRKIKSSDMLLHSGFFFAHTICSMPSITSVFGCVVEGMRKNGMLYVRDSLTFAFINSDALSFIFHSFNSDAV